MTSLNPAWVSLLAKLLLAHRLAMAALTGGALRAGAAGRGLASGLAGRLVLRRLALGGLALRGLALGGLRRRRRGEGKSERRAECGMGELAGGECRHPGLLWVSIAARWRLPEIAVPPVAAFQPPRSAGT
ncbi:hypothetical protein [Dankookia sp. P2]|uniref:hypothetical protein n=1 Tax=Dankookia sp. P2 TaxID=3423955 RepID=UPI003D676083